MRQGIFLLESTSTADSLTVSVQLPCAIACSNICARVKKEKKNQTLAAVPLFIQMKLLHTLIGMGSAALAAAVSDLGKATHISLKGQRNTIKRIKKNVWKYYIN